MQQLPISHASLKKLDAERVELREYIKTLTEDSYPHKIAVAHLQALGRQRNNISSNLPSNQPNIVESALPAPIKCGLRGISNLPRKEKVETWDWSNLNDKQTTVLERVQGEIKALFFLSAERHILKLILLSGGLKKALEKTSLSALAVLPDFVRKEQGKVLWKTFEEKLLK